MLQMYSDLAAFRRDPLALLCDRARDGAGLSRLRLGPKPVYLVADAQIARTVLRADAQNFDKGRHVAKLRRLVGMNSLTLSGEEHRLRRAAVHRGLAQSMADASAAGIGAMVTRWIAELAASSVIDVHQATGHLALRLVCAMLFGREAFSAGDEAALIAAVKLVEDDLAADMFKLLPHSPWSAWQRERRRRLSRAMMAQVIARTARRASRGALIGELRAAGLDGDALQDEILFLMLAGHHTTGAASAWTLYHQAIDPVLASGLVAEAARLDVVGDWTPGSLRGAGYSRAMVSEVLRLYPSSYWTSRDLARDHEVGGYHLKRGTTLIIAPWQLHRDARYWPNPDAFSLDRNWNSNLAYMPFGIGGRACTGMAMATFMLQTIVLQFATTFKSDVIPIGNQPMPVPSITLMPPPMRLRLVVRSNSLKSTVGVAA